MHVIVAMLCGLTRADHLAPCTTAHAARLAELLLHDVTLVCLRQFA
jgi:hypothetical protein